MRRHLVLVGLPASGKSTVGRLLAEHLGLGFVDLDETISAAEGVSVPELWKARGEAEFRRLELEHMDQALRGPVSVIAPGGGWAAIPGALGQVRELAFIIYLRVKEGTAAGRITGQTDRRMDGQTAGRPVLGNDPLGRMGELLDRREGFYLQADLVVDNEGSPEDAVAQILDGMSL